MLLPWKSARRLQRNSDPPHNAVTFIPINVSILGLGSAIKQLQPEIHLRDLTDHAEPRHPDLRARIDPRNRQARVGERNSRLGRAATSRRTCSTSRRLCRPQLLLLERQRRAASRSDAQADRVNPNPSHRDPASPQRKVAYTCNATYEQTSTKQGQLRAQSLSANGVCLFGTTNSSRNAVLTNQGSRHVAAPPGIVGQIRTGWSRRCRTPACHRSGWSSHERRSKGSRAYLPSSCCGSLHTPTSLQRRCSA